MALGRFVNRIKTRKQRSRESGSGRLAATFIYVILIAIFLTTPQFLQFAREKVFDIYQNLQPRMVPESRPVLIVDIDEQSLNEFGQWPWPRNVMADLVNRLHNMGAAVIAFDIVFPEADRMSPSAIARAVPQLDPDLKTALKNAPDNDRVFAEAIARANVVMGQAAQNIGAKNVDTYTQFNTTMGYLGVDPRPQLKPKKYMIRSLPQLNEAAKGHGLFNLEGGVDGVVRSVPMVVNVDNNLYPSLATEVLRLAVGGDAALVKASKDEGIQGIIIKPYVIETGPLGEYWVYFSDTDRAKYVSAVSVLNGTLPDDKFRGKIVLIGTSAVGLFDIKATPINPFMPGVEVHAQIIENVLTESQLKRPTTARWIELTVAAVLGLVLIVLMPVLTAQISFIVALALLGAVIGGSWYSFRELSTLYDPVYPTVVILTLYFFLSYRSFAREENRRQEVRDAFNHYLSPEFVQQLAANPGSLNLGGEMRDMTVMFSDIRRFTSISERLSAEELTQLINSYLTPMTDIVLRHQGTIDKYIGDCIMSFWNAPIPVDRHAKQACLTALEMEEKLAAFNAEWKKDAEDAGLPYSEFRIGIGINSGIACVGNIGSEQRFNYSVLGDTVNVSSRLESLTKTYGVVIIIGEETQSAVPEFATLELDRIRVRGREEPQKIFTLLGDESMAHDAEFKALQSTHNEMIKACRADDFEMAQRLLRACRIRPLRSTAGAGLRDLRPANSSLLAPTGYAVGKCHRPRSRSPAYFPDRDAPGLNRLEPNFNVLQ